MQDLRLALRALVAAPVASAVAVLSLALCIGGSTAIFSVVNGLLLRPLPVRDPGTLVFVTDTRAPAVRRFAYAVWEEFRKHTRMFDHSLAWSATELNLTSRGEAQLVDGL